MEQRLKYTNVISTNVEKNNQLLITPMKPLTFFTLITIGLAVTACRPTPSRLVDHQYTQITLGDHRLQVEVVTTPDSITQGLSDREKLGSDGMLFVLPQRQVIGFWMYRMKFDLDLIWIDGDRVLGVTHNARQQLVDQASQELPVYYPPGPVTMVLEVVAGQAEVWGVAPGTRFAVDDDAAAS